MLGNFSAKYLLKKVLTKESITGANINDNKPTTLKPGTKIEANQKHKPLTTKENVPKLNIFSGKENNETTGLTPALITPILTPAISAAGKLAIFTPENIISTTKRLNAVVKIVKSEPIIIY